FPDDHLGKMVDLAIADGRALGKNFPVAVHLALVTPFFSRLVCVIRSLGNRCRCRYARCRKRSKGNRWRSGYWILGSAALTGHVWRLCGSVRWAQPSIPAPMATTRCA